MKKLRAGVIGVGYLGQFHAEKYASLPQVELAGVVDADPARAALIAQKLNTRSFSDPADLLGSVDLVSIVVPTILHHRVAKQFLEQGVHVLLEKPITVTLEQADELIRLARDKGCVLADRAYRAVQPGSNRGQTSPESAPVHYGGAGSAVHRTLH